MYRSSAYKKLRQLPTSIFLYAFRNIEMDVAPKMELIAYRRLYVVYSNAPLCTQVGNKFKNNMNRC